MTRSLLRLAPAIVLGAATVATGAGAQTCPAPGNLTVNTAIAFDTCQGDYFLTFVCNLFPLTGPAAVIHLPLPYPTGVVTVQSLTPGYDPVVLLLHTQCENTAACGMIVDSGVVTDTMDLAGVDSGDYFLAVAPMDFSTSLACGQIMVIYSMTAQQQALALEGVFRGGISAPATNP